LGENYPENYPSPSRPLLLFLRKTYVRAVLLFIFIASLTMILFPIREELPVRPGTSWVYRYTERLFSNDVLVQEYRAFWRYMVANSTGTQALVLMESEYQVGRHLPDGSWVYDHGKERSSFIVDIKTRQYVGSLGYSSWWIPSEIKSDDVVPIWSSFLRVTGTAPRLLTLGRPLPLYRLPVECWILGFQSEIEDLTLYYEKTTGFFVYFSFQYKPWPNTLVSGERSLIATNLDWPLFSLLQPFLIPIFLVTLALLSITILDEVLRRLLPI
jgi:hypothetical protein